MSIQSVAVVLFAVSLSTTVCCSGSSGSCPGASMGPPTNTACVNCAFQDCASQFATAFGPNWMSNEVGGACASYIECLKNCDCNESCVAGCISSAYMGGCEQALGAVANCELANCSSECLPDLGTLK